MCESTDSSTSSSDFEEDLENVVVCAVLQRERRFWVHPVNRARETSGEYHLLVQELQNEHPERFEMYFRMTKEQFDFLHGLIKEDITKQNTHFRKAISTEERLAVCLRFLATGNSFRCIGFNYRMGFDTVRKIILEVCDAIWKNLGPVVMAKPTEELWKKNASRFKTTWNFPNCIGAIDGKHINIQCPINAGSTYYNYKGSNSIVLLALVDADYKFIAVDVGAYGRNSDGGIFEKSEIGKMLESETLSIPGKTPLEESGSPQPHVIVGDEAFPLKSYLVRPYSKHSIQGDESKKIFNYRLSRARRVVENAFGILVARWRVFRTHIEVQPEFVDKIVLACCCLHNMLASDAYDHDTGDLNSAEAAFQNVDGVRRNFTNEAFSVREAFKDFFNSPSGSVPWQINAVRKGRLND